MTTATVAAEDPTIPRNEKGEPYYAAFVRPDGATLFADTLTELVGGLINDYPLVLGADTITEDTGEALLMRLEALAGAAASTQALIAASVQEDSARRFSEYELTALFTNKDEPVTHLEEPWDDEEVQLLLLTTNYSPFTQVEKPNGKGITWLDPTNERAFLESLATVLGCKFWVLG